jgi:maleylacetoacetate isomerase/maleylpyruvate isomerase
VKLYSYFRSSAAFRVRIALNLKGISYETVPINLLKNEQAGEAYAAVNPQKRVPALDVGGTVLIQSPAILEYLDEVHPEPPLLPMGAVQRARVREVASIIACDIHPLNNLAPLRYLKRELGRDQAEIDRWYAHWIREGFDAVERLLEPGPYAFGARPGLADIYLVPQVFNARRLKVPLDSFPRIVAVAGACEKVEAFRKASPENQPDAA